MKRESESIKIGMREAMDRFPSSVVLVAVRESNGLPHPVLASAFNSVSLEPPIILWSVQASLLADIRIDVDQACGVSVLTHAQAASIFSKGSQCTEICWENGCVFGAPQVMGAAACFEAVVFKRIVCSDHIVFFAQVGAFSHNPSVKGALKYMGKLRHDSEILDAPR